MVRVQEIRGTKYCVVVVVVAVVAAADDDAVVVPVSISVVILSENKEYQ